MQTFLFEIDVGPEYVRSWSVELPSLHSAQSEAVKAFGELLSEHGDGFWDQTGLNMTVSDEQGLVLFRLQMHAVLAASMSKSERWAEQQAVIV